MSHANIYAIVVPKFDIARVALALNVSMLIVYICVAQMHICGIFAHMCGIFATREGGAGESPRPVGATPFQGVGGLAGENVPPSQAGSLGLDSGPEPGLLGFGLDLDLGCNVGG